MRIRLIVFVMMLGLAFTVTPSGAAILGPGGSEMPVVDIFANAQFGAVVADTGVRSFNSGGTTPIIGRFREIVVVDTVSGRLDFLYEITNDGTAGPPPADFIGRFTATDFAGFTTDVGIAPGQDLIPGQPHTPPSSADRGIPGPGSTVGWNFLTPTGVPILIYGTDSTVVAVLTNAPTFTAANVAVIDGGSVNIQALGPATPEPISLILLGSGLAGAGLFRRLRRKS